MSQNPTDANRWQTLSAILGDVILEMNRDGRIEMIAALGATDHGFLKSNWIGADASDFFPSSVWGLLSEPWSLVLDDGRSRDVEIGPGGFSLIARMARAEDGRGILTFRAPDRRELLMTAGDFGLWEWFPDENTVAFSERWAGQLGYETDELAGVCDTWFERIHPEDRPHVIREIQSHLRGLTSLWRMTYRMRHREGHWVQFLGHGMIERAGSRRRFVGVQADISPITMMEKELRTLSERYEIVLGANRVGTWDFDPIKDEVNYDHQALQIFGGFRPKAFSLAAWLEVVHPDEREAVRKRLLDGLTSGGAIDLRFRIQRPSDDLVRHLQLKAQMVRDDEGRRRLVGVLGDASSQVQKQQELEDQRRKSIQASKMASLGQMAGGIGHEIKNPLAVIQGAAQALERGLLEAELSPDQIARQVTRILTTTDRIDRIAKGLCKFARDGGGEAPQPCELKRIVDETLTFCEDRLRVRGIRLEVKSPPENQVVWCRSIQVSQALLNLVNNAADATEFLDEKWIRIEVHSNEKNLFLSVVDSGEGIPESVRLKMMDPFFTTKPSGEGTGLGLPIVHNLVQANGGVLEYGLREGRTCFSVRWTRSHGAAAEGGPVGTKGVA